MANEVDVKDVGDVSALSDTDKFQIIVNNLLKNIPAKTLYSILASKIPVATISSNGLMYPSLFDRAFKIGSLPASGTNIIGDISECESGYGWYNNSNSSEKTNAPARTAGLFIRFKTQHQPTTLFITNNAELFFKIGNKDCVKAITSPAAASANILTESYTIDPVDSNSGPDVVGLRSADVLHQKEEAHYYSLEKMANVILQLQEEINSLKKK